MTELNPLGRPAPYFCGGLCASKGDRLTVALALQTQRVSGSTWQLWAICGKEEYAAPGGGGILAGIKLRFQTKSMFFQGAAVLS